MSHKNEIFIVVIMLLTVLFWSNTVVADIDTSDIRVDQDVIDVVTANGHVSVVVLLRDETNLTFENNYSSYEKFNVLNERAEIFRQSEINTLSKLSPGDFTLDYKFSITNGFSGLITKSGIDKLMDDPTVLSISSNYKSVSGKLLQSIPLIGTNKVWVIQLRGTNLTGDGQGVCVIDSGVNYTHPYMGGCNQTENINNVNCDKVVGGYDYVNNDNDPMDDNGHGTHVAGIVNANGSLNGVAPNSKIISLKILNSSGSSTSSDAIINAIQWCTFNKTKFNISVITMSLGTDYPEVFSDYCDSTYQAWSNAINSAIAVGIFVDASTGNDLNYTHISSPACIKNVTSVGATDKNDVIREDSNRNDITDLFATGGEVKSLRWSTSFCKSGCICSDNKMVCSGTSQAAPHVAGLAALMKQANETLTPHDIQTIMNYTGKPIYDPATQLTFRRIDAFRSVLAVMHNLFISDFEIIDSNAGNRLFQFKTFNDLYTPIDVAWNISYGDGKSDANDGNLTLDGHQEAIVFASHDYSRPGNYTITVYANSTTDNSNAMSRTIEVRPIEVNSLKLLNSSSLKNVYGFNILSPESDLNVSWVFYPQDGTAINSTHNISLIANQTVFVYFENDYASAGAYNVTANATDTDKRYFDLNNMTVAVI